MYRKTENKLRHGNTLTPKKENLDQLMNEVGQELGVDENTRSINEDPKQFAQRMKKAIQKRT
ncbi:hypothetical protein [Hazenella coriacea]|uniref:Uncharacterized protein n=1 Tax=Hazenella coriacea TaxID=1179467 RepID=A0A4R3L5L8_9BACL|nr:hypothetical protein [Hazenella coriacea]TCS94692.1 hypothetical protein EDD58_103108 [Hazenella coriacea]